jgi:predicted RNase H-like HicB family nuclease
MKKVFTVLLYPQKEGGFTAICPDLDGCISEGDTLQEALENIKEAIELCLEEKNSMESKSDELPLVTYVQVG